MYDCFIKVFINNIIQDLDDDSRISQTEALLNNCLMKYESVYLPTNVMSYDRQLYVMLLNCNIACPHVMQYNIKIMKERIPRYVNIDVTVFDPKKNINEGCLCFVCDVFVWCLHVMRCICAFVMCLLCICEAFVMCLCCMLCVCDVVCCVLCL